MSQKDGMGTDDWWVVCLCAQWCGTCREYRLGFDALATSLPQVRFVWIDVEDQADVVGDAIDIETFPTLLLANGHGVRFFGVLPPQTQVLERMLQSVQGTAALPVPEVHVQDLFLRIVASQ